MALTPSGFKTRYEEFDSVSDSKIQVFLDDSELELNVSVWGSYYDKGGYALAAHGLKLSQLESSVPGGSISSKKVGDVQINYNVKSPDSSLEYYYNSTPYGQEYYRLMQLIAPSCFVANEDFVV